MNIPNEELLNVLRENVTQSKSLQKIYQIVMEKPHDDEHGNIETAQNRLDRVLVGIKAALADSGYAVYKLEPESKAKPRAIIPGFIKEYEIR